MTRPALGRAAAVALALLACAGMAQAQPDRPRSASWPDVPAWWGATGTAGWWPLHGYGAAPPRSLAGLVRGGWIPDEEEHARNASPEPGVGAVWLPLTWSDSVAVRGGEAAWTGFGAPLLRVTAIPIGATPVPGGPRRALSMFSVARGTAAEEEDGVSVARVDSTFPIRAEATTWERGATGALEKSGHHLWGGSAALLRGEQRFAATFTQRGSAAALASGEDQAATGLAGAGRWTRTHGGQVWSAALERGYHHHESVGDSLAFSRRDAQQQQLDLGWRREDGHGPEVRLAWQRASVDRATVGAPGDHTDEDQAWLAARDGLPLGGGTVAATVGAGWSRALDRVIVAPSLALDVPWAGFGVRAVAERLTDPVWSDLAPGTAPFLQDTWAGGLDVNRRGASWRMDATWRSGRTTGRAIAARLPLEDLWLRRGYASDPDPWTFHLVSAGASYVGGPVSGGVSGFVLGRSANPVQPRVDPGSGGRAWIESGVRLFAGDLLVRLRLEGAGVGPRESEAEPSRRLPAWASADAVVSVTLADAVFTLRWLNLEDRRQPETWLDPRTGVEALGPGREFRMTLSWLLFD